MDILSEYNQSAIADILESKNVYEYEKKFRLYADRLNACRIYLFD